MRTAESVDGACAPRASPAAARQYHGAFAMGVRMARTAQVAVIGAGIGGLAAACALRAHNFDVTLHERAPELAEVGAGLQLAPNATKVLRALGLENALRKLAFEPENTVSLAWNTGRLRFREPLKSVATAQFGAPYLMAHRADLHRLLCEKLPENSIRLNAQCTGVATHNGQAIATFADSSTVEADVIIGADGINSVTRECLLGPQPARYTRQMAWRCLVPIDCVATQVNGTAVGRDEYVGWLGPEGHVICY